MMQHSSGVYRYSKHSGATPKVYVPNNEDPQLLGWSHAQGFCTSGVHSSLTLQNLCSHIIFHVIALMSLNYVKVTYVWCLFGEIFLFTVCREQEILFLIDTECPVTNGWINFLQFYVCCICVHHLLFWYIALPFHLLYISVLKSKILFVSIRRRG